MEGHAILSETMEESLKAIEWAKEEQKRILKEKSERITKEVARKLAPFILEQKRKWHRDDVQPEGQDERIEEKELDMEGYHPILSERLEEQLKAIEWARAEQERILREKEEKAKDLTTN